MGNKNIADFRRKIAVEVGSYPADLKGYANLKNSPLHKKQCLYVFNWGKGGITFKIGLKDLLGYTKEELYLEDMMQLVHPEDRYFVENITKEAVQHTYWIDEKK